MHLPLPIRSSISCSLSLNPLSPKNSRPRWSCLFFILFQYSSEYFSSSLILMASLTWWIVSIFYCSFFLIFFYFCSFYFSLFPAQGFFKAAFEFVKKMGSSVEKARNILWITVNILWIYTLCYEMVSRKDTISCVFINLVENIQEYNAREI